MLEYLRDTTSVYAYNDGFSPAVAGLLVAMEVEECIPIFKQYNIGIKDFSELTEDDLIIMGIENYMIRKNILRYAINLPQNTQTLLGEKNTDLTLENVDNILNDSEKHITRICVSLRTTRLLLEKSKAGDDVVCFPNIYATDVTLRSIDQIENLLNNMEKELTTFKHGTIIFKKAEQKRRKMMLTSVSGIAMLVLTYCFVKSLKLCQ